MSWVRDIGDLTFRYKDAAQAAVVGGGLMACGGAYALYETTARIVGYADAPLFIAAGCCGLPLAVGGGAYALRRSGRLPLREMFARVRRDIYGEAGTPGLVEEEAVPADGATPTIQDPVAYLADSLHVLLVGFSGGGKTTLSHAMAMHLVRRGLEVIVMDPDAAPGLWRGCTVVGAGDNFEAISRTIRRLQQEVKARRELRARGQRNFPDIWVIIDEYADVTRECEQARPFVEDLLRRGRKLGIHLIMGVQDRLVKTLGFEGQGELRRNFTYVVDVYMDQHSGQRFLRIEQNNDRSNALVIPTPRLPDPEKLITPVELAAAGATVAQRRGLEPPQAIPAAQAAVTAVARVPVPVPGSGVRFPAKTAENGAKTAGNAGNGAAGNAIPFPAGTNGNGAATPVETAVQALNGHATAVAAPKPLTAAYVARFIEIRYEQDPDFADPPEWLEKDRAVMIALALHAGLSQNAAMRGVGLTAGGRYREYVKIVDKHLQELQAAWKRRYW